MTDLNLSSVSTSTGGVRIKKSQSLAGTVIGVFVGVGLILAAPVVLWLAESQHTAKDFAGATPVEIDAAADGYVTFTGTPEVAAPLACVENEQSCLYYREENQELITKQEEQCGDVSDDARIIESTVLECDEDGGNCEQCYLVERDVWETQNSTEEFATVTVGAYEVTFSSLAVMLGLEEEIVDLTETTRNVWTIFPLPDQLTVAGDASGGKISSAQKTFVLSPYDKAQTLLELQTRDSTRAWGLRIAAFFMLFIGFGSIFGPLRYFSHLMRKLPIVGPFIKEATGLVVGGVSLLLAIVTFIVLWLLVLVIKNIVILLIVVALLGIAFAIYMKMKKEPAKA